MSDHAASPRSPSSDSVPQTPVANKDEGALLSRSLTSLSVDEGGIAIHLNASGSYSTDKEKPRPKYSPPFVRHNANSQDDVFSSPTKGSNQGSSISADKKQAMEGHWRGARSGSSSSTDSLLKSIAADLLNRDPAASTNIVRPELAQSLYPPICCVFVANLLQSESDESIEASVTDVFRDFGKVWVKVRRDQKNMPFAFCQYTTVENAERAIIEGNGRMINGRPCRCEQAKAHRIFYVERKYGAAITPQEAMELFSVHGDIVLCRSSTATERATLDANPGVIIEYSMYDHGQNAYNAYKNNPVYKVSPLANMTKEKTPAIRKSPTYTSDQARAIISTYDVDRRSVFVGSLFHGITEQDIRQLFESFGTIREVVIREMQSKYNTDVMIFAFVEFQDSASTNEAIHGMHGFKLADQSGNVRPIRVYQKDTKPPMMRSVGSVSTQSPATAMKTPSITSRSYPMTPITPSPSSSGYAPGYPYAATPSPAWVPFGNSTWAQGCDMSWGQNSPFSYTGYATNGYSPTSSGSPYHVGLSSSSPFTYGSAPNNPSPGLSWYYYPGYGYVPYSIPAYANSGTPGETTAHGHPHLLTVASTEQDRSRTPVPVALTSSGSEAEST